MPNERNYIGFFLIRDGQILQSLTDLFQGPYEVHIYLVLNGQQLSYTAGIDPVTAKSSANTQARKLYRFMRKVLQESQAQDPLVYIVGGKTKLFEQIVVRAGVGLWHTTDHVEVLFPGNGSRALSLGERTALSNTQTLCEFLGAPLDAWFPELAEEYNRHHK